MANDYPKNPFDSWDQQRCHPNAPAGGGGPGNFTSVGPLQYSDFGWESLPHPNSPAGRYLTAQARQDFSRKLKWDPSDFSSEKLPGGYCLRRPQPSCFFRWSPNKGCPASFSQ